MLFEGVRDRLACGRIVLDGRRLHGVHDGCSANVASASQIVRSSGGVVGLTRPFVPGVTHRVGVVALHMNAGCVTEPLAERMGEISVIAIPASVGYLAQRLARLYRRSTLHYARSSVQAH
jgi:hypothetical protein